MATFRIDRINKEFMRRISDLLQMRIKKENVRDAIITEVRVSKDLGYAKVYYTVLDMKKQAVIQSALESVAGQLRSILGKETHLRTVPELHFYFDDSEIKARKMDELLERVAKSDAELAREKYPQDE